jgi:hypothetical protein
MVSLIYQIRTVSMQVSYYNPILQVSRSSGLEYERSVDRNETEQVK